MAVIRIGACIVDEIRCCVVVIMVGVQAVVKNCTGVKSVAIKGFAVAQSSLKYVST